MPTTDSGTPKSHDPNDGFKKIGEWFAQALDNALVISPDHESRRAINAAIRDALHLAGYLRGEGVEMPVLVSRDVLHADRTRAENYRVGDELRFLRDIASLAVMSKSYGTVTDLDSIRNKLTVKTADG